MWLRAIVPIASRCASSCRNLRGLRFVRCSKIFNFFGVLFALVKALSLEIGIAWSNFWQASSILLVV